MAEPLQASESGLQPEDVLLAIDTALQGLANAADQLVLARRIVERAYYGPGGEVAAAAGLPADAPDAPCAHLRTEPTYDGLVCRDCGESVQR